MTQRLQETHTLDQVLAELRQLRVDVDALAAGVPVTPRGTAALDPAPLAREWRPGVAVEVGTLRAFGGTVYEARQAHTTQADWTPPVTPALWNVHRPGRSTEADPAAWQAGLAVAVGEVFTYGGSSYRVVQAHTTQAGWEPPAAPALWEAL